MGCIGMIFDIGFGDLQAHKAGLTSRRPASLAAVSVDRPWESQHIFFVRILAACPRLEACRSLLDPTWDFSRADGKRLDRIQMLDISRQQCLNVRQLGCRQSWSMSWKRNRSVWELLTTRPYPAQYPLPGRLHHTFCCKCILRTERRW